MPRATGEREAQGDSETAAFALGGLTLLVSLFGLTIGRHPEIIHEVIDGTPVTHA